MSSQPPYRLYRCFDGAGRLLYVGISRDPEARQAQHRATSWWVKWVHRVSIETGGIGEDRTVAEAVEREVIAAETPVFNRHASTDSTKRIRAYLAGLGDCLASSSETPLAPSPREVALATLEATTARLGQADADWMAAIRAARTNGASIRAIAKAAQVNHQTIANRLKEN